MAQAMGQQGSLVLAPGTLGSPPVATWLLQFRDANDVHWKAVSLLFIIIYFINFFKEVILSHLNAPREVFSARSTARSQDGSLYKMFIPGANVHRFVLFSLLK